MMHLCFLFSTTWYQLQMERRNASSRTSGSSVVGVYLDLIEVTCVTFALLAYCLFDTATIALDCFPLLLATDRAKPLKWKACPKHKIKTININNVQTKPTFPTPIQKICFGSMTRRQQAAIVTTQMPPTRHHITSEICTGQTRLAPRTENTSLKHWQQWKETKEPNHNGTNRK